MVLGKALWQRSWSPKNFSSSPGGELIESLWKRAGEEFARVWPARSHLQSAIFD